MAVLWIMLLSVLLCHGDRSMDSASLGKELETEEECASEIDYFGRTFMARRLSQTMRCWDREGRLGAALLHNP